MRRLVCIIASAILALNAAAASRNAADRADTSGFAALDAKLEEYLSALAYYSIADQETECDFLIESSADSLVRQHIALKLYDHYLNSKIMGVEAVAIYLLDNWFFNGKIRMNSDIDLMNAHIYADFNRASLLGATAQDLSMTDIDGRECDVTPAHSKHFSVLYFYDTGCPNCLLTSVGLDNLFRGDCSYWQVDVYAIYTGTDEESWRKYCGRHFCGYGVPVTNLWDPELRSDFQRKYGVLQTPRLYLVADKGEILGRGLDVNALKLLLDNYFPRDVRYGGEKSDADFAALTSAMSLEELYGMVDYLADSNLGVDSGIRDTLVFKGMTGDLLYYLSKCTEGRLKKAEEALIDKNIFGRPEVWRTSDDSIKVVGYAALEKEFLGRTPVGSRLPKIVVTSELRTASKPSGISKKWRLDRLRADRNYILFYTPDCGNCKKYLETVDSLVGEDTSVLLVELDSLMNQDRSSFEKVMDTFDLRVTPFMMLVDRRGMVLDKYLGLPK